MNSSAIDCAGHDIRPVYKKHRSASSPEPSSPLSPTTPHERMASLMGLRHEAQARDAMAKCGAKMMLNKPEPLAKPVVDKAIGVAYEDLKLDEVDFYKMIRALKLNPNMNHPLKANENVIVEEMPQSPKVLGATLRNRSRIPRRKVSRRTLEKRASCFDRQTMSMLGPILGAVPTLTKDAQAIKQGLGAISRKVDRVISQGEELAAEAAAQSAASLLPDWQSQSPLDYIRARWRGRGSMLSRTYWQALGFIVLRGVSATIAYVLGLVSFALPFRYGYSAL